MFEERERERERTESEDIFPYTADIHLPPSVVGFPLGPVDGGDERQKHAQRRSLSCLRHKGHILVGALSAKRDRFPAFRGDLSTVLSN